MASFISVVREVFQALVPLLIFFLIFQYRFLNYPKERLMKLITGVIITAAGLIVFLYGIYLGFLPAGLEIGRYFGSLEQKWLLIPLGFFLGFLATFAEPAVRVLCYQVEKSSNGYVRSKMMLYTLSISVAIFVALTMVKLVYGFSFHYIALAGYISAIILMWLSDRDFIAVAFDAGGVATGPMSVTFLMSMAVGAAETFGGRDAVVDGFGIIAMIALAPIIFVMLIGVYIRFRGERNDA